MSEFILLLRYMMDKWLILNLIMLVSILIMLDSILILLVFNFNKRRLRLILKSKSLGIIKQ